jgi:cardiolipin synthase
MNLSGLPNAISIFRILLVPPVALLIYREDYLLAMLLFAVAGVSDGIDGYLAKRFGWTSRLGSILDPLADKFLVLITFLMLTLKGLLPGWLFVLVFVRDLGILSLSLYYLRRLRESFEIRPQWSSKINTVLQIALVLVVMFRQTVPALPTGLVEVMVALVTLTTVWSWVSYMRMWGGIARKARSEGQ